MTTHSFSVAVAALLASAALFFTGCSPQNTSDTPAQTASTSVPGLKTCAITGGDNMKFNLARITAAPGEAITVTFINTGTQPKAAMGHNWVLLNKSADAAAFANAAIQAQATDYLPVEKQAEIIAHTKLLGAGESDTITFKAPTEPGDYPYLCTFPAHYQIGMKGVLTVR